MWFFSEKTGTQKSRVLAMLRKSPRKPYEFTNEGIMSYTKVIQLLKKDGWAIETRTNWIIEKNRAPQRHSTYILH